MHRCHHFRRASTVAQTGMMLSRTVKENVLQERYVLRVYDVVVPRAYHFDVSKTPLIEIGFRHFALPPTNI